MKECSHKTESGYCTAFERECDAHTCNPYCCEYEPSDVCSRSDEPDYPEMDWDDLGLDSHTGGLSDNC